MRKISGITFHLYHYAGNNPVKYVDPDGRNIFSVLGTKIKEKFSNYEFYITFSVGAQASANVLGGKLGLNLSSMEATLSFGKEFKYEETLSNSIELGIVSFGNEAPNPNPTFGETETMHGAPIENAKPNMSVGVLSLDEKNADLDYSIGLKCIIGVEIGVKVNLYSLEE